VPLVAAAVCPNPPLLVPELAAGAAAELDDLRAACDAAVARLWSAGPELVAVVGAGSTTRELPPPYRGSFAPWGASVGVALGEGAPGDPVTDLAPLVGLWLLSRQDCPAPVTVWSVAVDAVAADCAVLGKAIAATAGRVALLVLGDGSACHGRKSPGYEDRRAEPFDAAVLEALVDVDTARLLALDAGLADQLLAAGRAPWQVLAGAVAGAGRRWRSHVGYAGAPYGVGYYVANWS